jgi:hypothetical protein
MLSHVIMWWRYTFSFFMIQFLTSHAFIENFFRSTLSTGLNASSPRYKSVIGVWIAEKSLQKREWGLRAKHSENVTGTSKQWQLCGSNRRLFCRKWRSVTFCYKSFKKLWKFFSWKNSLLRSFKTLKITNCKILKIHLVFLLHRSTNKNMVLVEHSWTALINPRYISLLLPLRRSTLHEKSKTLSAQKHTDHLQRITSCF